MTVMQPVYIPWECRGSASELQEFSQLMSYRCVLRAMVQGFNNVNAVLRGGHSYAAVLLVQILLTKILVTSICRGSGALNMSAASTTTVLPHASDRRTRHGEPQKSIPSHAGLIGGIYAPSIFQGAPS